MKPAIKEVRDAVGLVRHLIGHARDGQVFVVSAHGILSPTALRQMLRGRIAEHEDELQHRVGLAVWPSTDAAGHQVLTGLTMDGTRYTEPVEDRRLTLEAMRLILRGRIAEHDDEHGNGEP